MCGGQPQSTPILVGDGITLCLSRIPTPETRGHVCQISSLHNLQYRPEVGELPGEPADMFVKAKLKIWAKYSQFLNKNFFILNIIQIFT
jgi:hypothetical protein